MTKTYKTAKATDLTPDVSGWNTSKVKDMSFMFSEVTFDPDVSDWNTSSVSDMSFMESMY